MKTCVFLCVLLCSTVAAAQERPTLFITPMQVAGTWARNITSNESYRESRKAFSLRVKGWSESIFPAP